MFSIWHFFAWFFFLLKVVPGLVELDSTKHIQLGFLTLHQKKDFPNYVVKSIKTVSGKATVTENTLNDNIWTPQRWDAQWEPLRIFLGWHTVKFFSNKFKLHFSHFAVLRTNLILRRQKKNTWDNLLYGKNHLQN